MKWILRIVAALGAAFLVLVAVLGINTWRYVPKPIVADIQTAPMPGNLARAVKILSEAVKFETDSTKPGSEDFDAFLNFIEASFPRVHAELDHQLIAGGTPLYRWKGDNPDLGPILLAAHYDVVPISPGSLDRWEHPPYSGTVQDGFVWGRGTLDNKGALVAILTTVEEMLEDGFKPQRDIYLSFGHDEEVGGKGAQAVAQRLNDAGIQLDWILDEGSFVLEGIIAGLKRPVASINISEKGYATLELVASAPGGHSSLPPRDTAVGRLASALDKLQNAPVPGGLDGISADFFDALGRHFELGQRIVFANQWLFRPLLESILSASATTDAMLRTTTAPTMLQASNKENVLATQAIATVNFRLHPRDTVESLIAYVSQVVGDEKVEVRLKGQFASPASPVSDPTSQGFLDIEAGVRTVFGPVAAVPGMTIAATDARHYAKAAKNAFRINPFKIGKDDIARFHGTNERLSIENLERGISFYKVLLRKQ